MSAAPSSSSSARSAGAGVLVWVGVAQLVPGPDPREHRDAPLDHADVLGPAFVTMLLVLAGALPALGVVALGEAQDSTLLEWLGVPAGALTGGAAYVLLGSAAYRGLAARGPDLLYLMRAGKEQGAQGEAALVLDAMPRSRRQLLLVSVFVGCVALFPQAIVPAAMKLSGDAARVWFLALYLPKPWQWPVIVLMGLLGVGALALAVRLYVTARCLSRLAGCRGRRPRRYHPSGGSRLRC